MVEKVIKRKGKKNYMLSGKAMIIHLIAGLIKVTSNKMSQYLPKPYETFGGDINLKVDFSNYVTKTDFIKATEVDTSNLEQNLIQLI